MKRLAIFVLFLMMPTNLLAHSGSGSPYALVDGQYAPGNPLFNLYLDLPQDIAPAVYTANKSISFAVDTNILKGEGFRWIWPDGSTSLGDKASYTFPRSGTYDVKLQVPGPGSVAYSEIDSIQVAVGPTPGYRRPTVKMRVEQAKSGTGYQLNFSAETTTDPSSSVRSVEWKFGDGTSQIGQSVSHKYEGSAWIFYPKARVTDANGVYTDVAIKLEAADGKVTPSNLPGAAEGLASGQPTNSESSPFLPLIVGIPAVLLVSLVAMRLRRLRKS